MRFWATRLYWHDVCIGEKEGSISFVKFCYLKDNVVSASGVCDFLKKPGHSIFVRSLLKLVLLNEQNGMP